MVKFTAIVLIALAAFAGRAEEMIYWFLDDPDIYEVGGGSSTKIADLVGTGAAAGLTADYARVAAYDSSGSFLRWLSIDSDGLDWTYSDTDIYVDVSVQSGVEGSLAGPAYADVSAFISADGTYDPEISFIIEIGTYTGTGESAQWIALAASEASTLEQLRDADHLISDNLGIHGTTAWTGGSYVVPEPGSGLLLLVGAGLLALRRRRRVA